MPFFGEGLDGIFRRRSNILSGILNGIDQGIWNPRRTHDLKPFSPRTLPGKASASVPSRRSWVCARTPPARSWSPLGASPTRRAWAWCATPWTASQAAACRWPFSAPATQTRRSVQLLQNKYGDMMCARIAFDNALSHRMYAGGDLLLMPSEFEPCGLSQMIAMRYGTLPVVRETGGLRDSVQPYNKFTGGAPPSFASQHECGRDGWTPCWVPARSSGPTKGLVPAAAAGHGRRLQLAPRRKRLHGHHHRLHPEVIPLQQEKRQVRDLRACHQLQVGVQSPRRRPAGRHRRTGHRRLGGRGGCHSARLDRRAGREELLEMQGACEDDHVHYSVSYTPAQTGVVWYSFD